MSTHLSLSHVARQRSVLELWQHVSAITSPVILTGDFNAEAHNDEIRYCCRNIDLAMTLLRFNSHLYNTNILTYYCTYTMYVSLIHNMAQVFIGSRVATRCEDDGSGGRLAPAPRAV